MFSCHSNTWNCVNYMTTIWSPCLITYKTLWSESLLGVCDRLHQSWLCYDGLFSKDIDNSGLKLLWCHSHQGYLWTLTAIPTIVVCQFPVLKALPNLNIVHIEMDWNPCIIYISQFIKYKLCIYNKPIAAFYTGPLSAFSSMLQDDS